MLATPTPATGTLRDGRRFAAFFCSPDIGPLKYWTEAQHMLDTGVLPADADLSQGATPEAVEKLMRDTLYLPATTKLTVASMTEFIRVHKDALQKLDPVLFKARGSEKPHLVSYLNDIIEGKLEPPNGWIRKALALEAPPAPMLAIADGTVGS